MSPSSYPAGIRLRTYTNRLTVIRPLPRRVTRAASIGVLIAWILTIGVLVERTYVHAGPMNLATDLARYGTSAEWRGVYYRGAKIGYSVSQVTPQGDGYELLEDARLQMSLLGATTAAAIRTDARLDRAFMLRSFEFSLDPGTGPVRVSGDVSGRHLTLTLRTPAGGTQTEERDLDEPPMLSVNLPRRLAAEGLKPGTTRTVLIFDPATMRNEKALVAIGHREIVRVSGTSIPAFKVDLTFAGLKTSDWITDTGNVVREESPLGLLSERESAEDAQRMAINRQTQVDLLDAAAIVPVMRTKGMIIDGRDVERLGLRMRGLDLSWPDLEGGDQSLHDGILEIRDPRTLTATRGERDLDPYLKPEPLIESADPAIRAEAASILKDLPDTDVRGRAERLTRQVNAMLDKKPTVSLPSAREVLRTRVGDCNEHTALFVALARAAGIPARIDVGLVYVRGAFYYHAWPEVYISEGHDSGFWLPVDPTLNQYPADATHVRLLRGGLARQAEILPLIGTLKMQIVDLQVRPNSTPILAGPSSLQAAPIAPSFAVTRRCWSNPGCCTGASR